MTREPRGGEGGFALVSVLWILVGISALALTANLAARDAVSAAGNRVDLAAAAWAAEACVERVRAAADEGLAERFATGGLDAWRRLDRAVAESPLLRGEPCDAEVYPLGAALDLNAASTEALVRLLVAAGVLPASADSLADALADWRDPDDLPRPLGAEAEWYAARGLRPPRNGPLADVRELRRVRGWESVPGAEALLTVEPGRIAVNHAPPAVLASLPGFTPEVVARIEEMRMRDAQVADLGALAGDLTPTARDEFLRAYAELAGLATVDPDAWMVRARAAVGVPAAVAVVEVKLVSAGTRTAVARRRSWIE
jgi:general secretion pathway protein K